VLRAGDQLVAVVTLLSGNDPNQSTLPPFSETGETTLSRDGTALGTSPLAGIGVFPIPDSPGTYTLRGTASRAVPWSVIGTSADVTWTFDEPGAAAPAAPLPLLVIRASGDVESRTGRRPASRSGSPCWPSTSPARRPARG
jgi:hypothetical protein